MSGVYDYTPKRFIAAYTTGERVSFNGGTFPHTACEVGDLVQFTGNMPSGMAADTLYYIHTIQGSGQDYLFRTWPALGVPSFGTGTYSPTMLVLPRTLQHSDSFKGLGSLVNPKALTDEFLRQNRPAPLAGNVENGYKYNGITGTGIQGLGESSTVF